ncbi:ABC transporter permease [Propioniciclava flava]|uniref:Macrolide ABC transporter permease n=1 Tax=Propioniciclava flava TaxID=2072026 RepID=A0A4Q2EIQ4_9ACTN|nr:ABC transporter permease [Propioniciclava flava]RXW32294.1 macrolide ABC transporter permease [Propioniciclava flava]
MTWTETLRTAWEALNGRRMRSLLTMLGILIGIAAVMLTVGLGEGARLQIGKEINKLGSNLLIVIPGNGGLSSGLSGSSSGGFSLADAQVISDPAIAPDVAGVAPVMTSGVTLQYGTKDTSTQVNGTLPAWARVRARTLSEGRFFTEAEQASAAQVAVLGPETARSLFDQEPPVGKEIVVSGQTFVVIGVLESSGSASLSNDDDVLVIPMSTMAQRLSTPSGALTINTMYVAARDDASITAAHQEITRALTVNRQTTTADQDFSIFTFQALLTAANTMTGVLTSLLGGLAAISLVVGGIGVMNIMLVSVSERVREIGLRKALGATPRLIRRQFMVEAGILGLLGGALGVLVGLLGAAILTPLLNLQVTLSLPATVLALAVSLGIGVIAGVYPAARAANLPPIDALRSE